MSVVLVPLLPLAAALLSLLPLGRRFAPSVTVAAAAAALALGAGDALRVAVARRLIVIAGWVELDGSGALLLLLVTFVSATAALFSWGYVARHEADARRVRLYCAHFNLFTFALALVPVLAEPALVWIAVELTAVFSVLLVAFDNTRGALEAAWKYIALMFMGAAIALLGFFVLFWAQQMAGGGHYSWDGLRAVAPRLPPVLVMAAFLLILVGFGTKVGFVPMHTWLPDAHSQAPSPVCALLSGVKTTSALYCILRLVPLLPPASVGAWMRGVGLISAGVAAFLLLQVRDYKRLFAFSTVEHMGIIFVAAGLGGPRGMAGAMLQMVSHSVTKSFCFLAAGAALLVLGTREIASVRGLLRTSPATGAALLLGALAIGGAPPFAVFLSEFSIFRAGLEQGRYLVTALLAIAITVAFFGILLHVNRMVFGVPLETPSPARAALPATCLLTLVLAALPILVLGVYQPAWLDALSNLAAATLAPLAPASLP
ncbi:MAG TPA: proton-conducting transporter membrane subunit [Thermoanaerobaculia bacterium]